MTAQPSPNRTAWLVSLTVTGLALGATVWLLARSPEQTRSGTAPASTGEFSGRAPDISTLTSRQAFDRLFNRVMAAVEQGDSAGVIRFTEHALAAYTQVDSVDADARYHAAMLNAQVARYQPALALADSILQEDPGHLFGHLIRGTVAELRGDSAALAAARRDFLVAWSRDPGTGRPEYPHHRQVLEEFHAAARPAQ